MTNDTNDANDAYMKLDAGKRSRPELLDPEWLLAVGEALKFGAEKYSDNRWREGMAWSRVYGALQRHLLAFWAGEDLDEETGFSHLSHASCCLMFLWSYADLGTGPHADLGTYGTHDDRP